MTEVAKKYYFENSKRYFHYYRPHYTFINKTCNSILKINFKPKGDWLCEKYEITINVNNLKRKNYEDYFEKKKIFEEIKLVEPDYYSLLKFFRSDKVLVCNKKETEKEIYEKFTNTVKDKKFSLIPLIKDEIIEELLKLKKILEDIFEQKLKFSSTVICGNYVDKELPTIGVTDDLCSLSPKHFDFIDNILVKKGNICNKCKKFAQKLCKYCYERCCSNCSIECFECKKTRCKTCGIKKCPKCSRLGCFNEGYKNENPFYNPGLGPIYCKCLDCNISFCLKCLRDHHKEEHMK